MIPSDYSSVPVGSHPSLAGSLWVNRTLDRKELPAMNHDQSLRSIFEAYRCAREEFDPHKSYSDFEALQLDMAKAILRLYGLPLHPIESSRPQRGKKRDLVRSNREDGFVYVMRNARNGYFKIGYSKNPRYREATLQAEEPEIELISAVKAHPIWEEQLHRRFSHLQVRGEWFRLASDHVAQIQELFSKKEAHNKKVPA